MRKNTNHQGVSAVALIVMGPVILFILGCTAPRKAREGKVPDFTIEWGESGGFTGMTQAYRITSAGLVCRWTRLPGREPEEKRLGQLQPELVKKLWERIDKAQIPKQHFRDRGNITRFLRLEVEGQKYEISWPVGPPSTAPTPVLAELIGYLEGLVAGLKNSW